MPEDGINLTDAERWKADEALAYLNGIRRQQFAVKRLQDEIAVARSMSVPRGLNYEGAGGSGGNHDALERAVIRIRESIERYCVELAELMERIDEAHNAIKQMDDERHRAVLTEYYIIGKEWQQVGEFVGYTPDYCRELRTAALPKFWEVMPREHKTRIPRAE